MSSLLIHSDLVPVKAREALRAALAAPGEERHERLAAAARVLHVEADLDCRDALELVGLERLEPHLCGSA